MKTTQLPMYWIAAALLLVSGCSTARETSWMPSAALVAEVEAHLTLPEGAQPIGAYGRYYYGRVEHGRRVLAGEFVLGDATPGVHIVSPMRAPKVLDGGCSVVNLIYDLAQKRVTALFCNGSG